MTDSLMPESILTDKDLRIIELEQALKEAQSKIPAGRSPKSWSYYSQLRKDNPVEYWKPSTQRAMEEDAAVLNDKFMDGDFNSNKFKDSYERRAQRRGKDIYIAGTSEFVGSI